MYTNLNVGSGTHPAQGWLNVDIGACHGVNVRASAHGLPFQDRTFERVYLGHVLEHLPWDDITSVLDEISRVSVSDAVLCVVGPCLDKAVSTHQPAWLLDQIRVNGGTGPGDHKWNPTTDLTFQALVTAGCAQVREVPVGQTVGVGWPNTVADTWQCAFLARLNVSGRVHDH